MSVSNVAFGPLDGSALAVPLMAAGSFPTTSLAAQGASAVEPGSSGQSARDGAVSNLRAISSTVNLLAQAAAAQNGSSSGDPLMSMPPLPPMPAPKAPPAVPTDDHGQSNVVFSDPDADGDLIH